MRSVPLVSIVVLALVAPSAEALGTKDKPAKLGKRPAGARVKPTRFELNTTGVEYNASGIVEISEGRFLLCDNKTPDALFELRLDAEGRATGPLVRRPLTGVTIGDPEGMAAVDLDGKRFVIVTSSFNRKHGYEAGRMVALDGFADGFLRVEVAADGTLSAQNMAGVREWLMSKYASVLEGAERVPDQGGLNIEGFAWDPVRCAMLFGLRTPLVGGRPVVLPVRLKNGGGPWTTESLEALPPVVLQSGLAPSGHGVRGMCYDPTRGLILMSFGKAISGTRVNFAQCLWDGGGFGTLKVLWQLSFAKGMKAEGITHATLGGRGAFVYVDDAGGYVVLWDDDERLKQE